MTIDQRVTEKFCEMRRNITADFLQHEDLCNKTFEFLKQNGREIPGGPLSIQKLQKDIDAYVATDLCSGQYTDNAVSLAYSLAIYQIIIVGICGMNGAAGASQSSNDELIHSYYNLFDYIYGCMQFAELAMAGQERPINPDSVSIHELLKNININ